MKWKFYLRTCAAALAAFALMSGCSSNDEEPNYPPPPVEQHAFSIAVTDITSTSALLTVTPERNSAQATWYCSVVDKSTFDGFASDAAYIQDDLAHLKAEADKASMTLDNFLKTVIETGSKSVPFAGLDASTDYYAYVYGITAQGAVTSPLSKFAFTTQAASVDPDELTFRFSVTNITKTAADVNVIPSNNDDTYYFDISPASAFEGMTDEEKLAWVIEGLTADDLSRGPDGISAELIEQYAPFTPGTDYFVYAVGFDPQQGATTSLSMYLFTTEEATGTAPTLTLTAQAGDRNGANKSSNVTSTAYSPEAVSALYVAAQKSAVDGLLDKGATLDNVIVANGKEINAAQLAELNVEPGLKQTFVNLTPETTYSILIKVTGEGGMSTIERVDVSTERSNVQPSDMTFVISADNITATGAAIVITPSNNTDTYFFDVQKKTIVDSYDGDFVGLIAALNATYAQYGGIGGMLSTGVETYDPKNLSPNTSYYVIAFGYDEDTATTPLTLHEFKTASAATSDLTFEITVDPTQPVPGGVTATITPSNNDETYLVSFTLADEIDALTDDAQIIAYYEEEYAGFISWLTVAGVYQTMPTDFGGELAMMPGADYYIVAFGYGENGATTDVYKTRIVAGAGPDPAGTTFSFAATAITDASATVTVTASKEPVAYMWDILSEADYNEMGGNTDAISAYIAAQFEYYGEVFTPRQIIAGLGAWFSGASYDYSELDPQTVYIPFAVCVDVEGNVVDTPVIGTSFTTLAATAPAAVPEFFGRYEVGDLRPRIYRPLTPRGASKARIEALVGRHAADVSATQARLRGIGLQPGVRVPVFEADVQTLHLSSADGVTPRKAIVRVPGRTTVRTPRR